MEKIPQSTFLIHKRGKYCPFCGRYSIRNNTSCPHCKANWSRRDGRCGNCEAAVDPEWSFCEICGVETARARRLKRAKMLSREAKYRKAAHSQLPPPRPKSPDLFGPDPDADELAAIELTMSDQQSERTPATESTTVSDGMNVDDVVESRDNS